MVEEAVRQGRGDGGVVFENLLPEVSWYPYAVPFNYPQVSTVKNPENF
jgi:hypothetical protein